MRCGMVVGCTYGHVVGWDGGGEGERGGRRGNYKVDRRLDGCFVFVKRRTCEDG